MNRIYLIILNIIKTNFLTFIIVFIPFLSFSLNEDLTGNKSGFIYFNGRELLMDGGIDTIRLGDCYQSSGCLLTLEVKNQSDVTLWITNVRGSCALSVPAWPRNKINPGETGTIQIRFDNQRIGRFNRNLTIHANTFSGTTIFKVVGHVHQPPG